MKKIFISFMILFVLAGCAEQEVSVFQAPTVSAAQTPKISFLSWNIQIFGVSKIAKKEVMDIIIDTVKKFDVIAIQEVRDASGTSVPHLMKLLPSHYKYFLGPKEGRSSSKEQYLFIFNSNKITLVDTWIYPDKDDIFERNPLAAKFKSNIGNFDFIGINNHISPGDAKKEIAHLPTVIGDALEYFNEKDVLTVGDFNADGNYFNEKNMFVVFDKSLFFQIIDNDLDTTVATDKNTYDRIVATTSIMEDYTQDYGVYLYEDNYNFEQLSIQVKEVSDHYPVWAEFYADRDTD